MVDNKYKKSNFKNKKNCAITSIKEIEKFLHNFNIVFKSLKIYKYLK